MSLGSDEVVGSRLRQQILDSADPETQTAQWTCRALGELRALCAASSVRLDDHIRDLAELFDRLLASSPDPEFRRQATIYSHRLEPAIQHYFAPDEQEHLRKALKTIIVLRLLGVPYRAGCPTPAEGKAERLLASLYGLCGGAGLMVWDGEGAPVYVVETAPEQFVEWVVARSACFLGRDERDKTVSDAVWSALFPVAGHDAQPERELLPTGRQTCSTCLSGNTFPGREAVRIRCPDQDEYVLIFESLWEADRGRRVHRGVRALAGKFPMERVGIWIPGRPTPQDEELIVCYMATAQAMRRVFSCGGGRENERWLVRALQGQYLQVSRLALAVILKCYRHGMVVTDRGIWRPGNAVGSLVHLIGDLVTWSGMGGLDARCRKAASGKLTNDAEEYTMTAVAGDRREKWHKTPK